MIHLTNCRAMKAAQTDNAPNTQHHSYCCVLVIEVGLTVSVFPAMCTSVQIDVLSNWSMV